MRDRHAAREGAQHARTAAEDCRDASAANWRGQIVAAGGGFRSAKRAPNDTSQHVNKPRTLPSCKNALGTN
jgi:hypothetical protein